MKGNNNILQKFELMILNKDLVLITTNTLLKREHWIIGMPNSFET